MRFWFFFILVVVYGACIGSFLNVVIYRLPAGLSLVKPGSHCPRCNHALAWYDNLPVIGWLKLRGRCRHCRTPISIQYPLIEAFTAAMFGGLMLAYYQTNLRPDFAAAGFIATWPVLAVHLALIASLIAATIIDARLYIIPIGIPWTASVIAAVGLPLGTGWDDAVAEVCFTVRERGMGIAAGGLIGVGIATLLLHFKWLPLSFADDPAAHDEQMAAQQQADAPIDPEQYPVHPHARREVLKECLFLLFPIVGAVIGWWLLAPVETVADRIHPLLRTSAPEPLPGWMVPAVQVFGGVALGYLMGGALVWATRIFGTLAFGKEAMGLGDVHLLGAIGAVLGPIDVVYVFFAAPFFGLTAALASNFSEVLKGKLRVIPYGPYLAMAAVAVMLLRDYIEEVVDLRMLLP